MTHHRWTLQQRCQNTHLFNETVCDELYAKLPYCLEQLQYALESSVNVAEHKLHALYACANATFSDLGGTMLENVKQKVGCDVRLRVILVWLTFLMSVVQWYS